jgi:4-oxalocrotonate tautomerase
MPLVRISLRAGKPVGYRRALGMGVHQALIDALGISPQDHFQIISEHDADGLIYDPAFLGIVRTDNIVIIQITLKVGRNAELKKALYTRIAANLKDNPGIRPEDVFIQIHEVAAENSSYGNGLAQFG